MDGLNKLETPLFCLCVKLLGSSRNRHFVLRITVNTFFRFRGACFHSWEISLVTFYQVNSFYTSRELVFTSWEISIITFYLVNTFFHFLGTYLNSWEISIITFYQVNTFFHFPGTRFHFLGNLNYYPIPDKYPFLLPGNFRFPVLGK